MLKIFQSSIFRAICSIIVGALLIEYRNQTLQGITIAIGVLFFVSGIISFIDYFISRRHVENIEVYDSQGNVIYRPKPTFPLVGIASILLGALLALAPNAFVGVLSYILAIILVIGALNQYFYLAAASHFAKIGFFWWIFPTLILLIGIITIIKPSLLADALLFIIGWTMMIYGVVELVNGIKVYRCKKAYAKAHPAATTTAESTSETADSTASTAMIEEAVVVEEEAEKTEKP